MTYRITVRCLDTAVQRTTTRPPRLAVSRGSATTRREAAMKAVIEYKNGRVPSVTIAGLTVSRFARQIDGTYTAVVSDPFGGDIDLDQPFTIAQVMGLVQDAADDAEEHGEPVEVVFP